MSVQAQITRIAEAKAAIIAAAQPFVSELPASASIDEIADYIAALPVYSGQYEEITT